MPPLIPPLPSLRHCSYANKLRHWAHTRAADCARRYPSRAGAPGGPRPTGVCSLLPPCCLSHVLARHPPLGLTLSLAPCRLSPRELSPPAPGAHPFGPLPTLLRAHTALPLLLPFLPYIPGARARCTIVCIALLFYAIPSPHLPFANTPFPGSTTPHRRPSRRAPHPPGLLFSRRQPALSFSSAISAEACTPRPTPPRSGPNKPQSPPGFLGLIKKIPTIRQYRLMLSLWPVQISGCPPPPTRTTHPSAVRTIAALGSFFMCARLRACPCHPSSAAPLPGQHPATNTATGLFSGLPACTCQTQPPAPTTSARLPFCPSTPFPRQ